MVEPGRGKTIPSERLGRNIKKSARFKNREPETDIYSLVQPTSQSFPSEFDDRTDTSPTGSTSTVPAGLEYNNGSKEASTEEALTESQSLVVRLENTRSTRKRHRLVSPVTEGFELVNCSGPVLDHENGNGEDIGPFPGGPEDPSILKSFKTHVAYAIWDEQDRFPLKCIHHAHKLVEWKLDGECDRFRQKVAQSGLSSLARHSYRYIDRVLISSFVERWHPETNTFHLPFGEMTITLDDVKQILDIPILGRTVSGPNINYEEAERLLTSGLGVSSLEAKAEIERSFSVRMEWLRTKLSNVPRDAPEEMLDCAVRGYLLYLLGCTLFADKTGTRISVFYLQSLMDLEQVGEYAWGSGGLAFLYRQLGHASRAGVKQIAGYLTLLEAWIYEHFRVSRPAPDLSYVEEWPRMRRWKPKTASGDPSANLQVIREQLDDLSPFDVMWDPYTDRRHHQQFEDVAYYTGCLLCYEIVEPYHPERVLRQFGRVQRIPHPPLEPTKATRGMTSQKYKVEYPLLEQYWERWQNHVLSHEERGHVVVNPWDCSCDYLQWFQKVTHKFVQNPERRMGRQPYLSAMGGDVTWKQKRDKVLALLEESFAFGSDQDVGAMLVREREIYDILMFDQVPTQ